MLRVLRTMATDDVEYYTKVNKLQEFLKEKETKRMELDHQFNQFMRSDKRMSSSRAAKLQAYWQQVCENERKSQARNRELLQDFDRVEAHVATLAARTERLRLVQEQYQKRVDQKYPNWRQRYLEKMNKRQTADSFSSSQTNDDSLGSYKLDDSRYRQQSPVHTQPDHLRSPAESPLRQQSPDIPFKSAYPTSEVTPAGSYNQKLNIMSPVDSDGYLTVEPSKLSQKESEPFVISDDKYLPQKVSSSDMTDRRAIDSGLAAGQRQVTGHSFDVGHLQSMSGGDVSSRTEPFSSAEDEESQEDEHREEQEVSQDVNEQLQVKADVNPPSSATQDTEFIDLKQEDNEGVNDKIVGEEALARKPEVVSKSTKLADSSDPAVSESSEDIESDLSLPLSEDEAQPSPSPPVGSMLPEAQGPELTTDGFSHLIMSLEHVIERSQSEVHVYDGKKCSQEQKSCIAQDANAKMSLDGYDSLTMSRVLLQELPLLIQASPRGYLLSDQVLKSDRPILEVTVRSAITTNALPYWDHTVKHMVFLVKKGLFECQEIAEIVAPLMMAKDSVMAKKAIEVVTSLLEEAVEEPTLDESSITQTSMEDTPASPEKEKRSVKPEKVPPLNLDESGEKKESSSEDEDSFFDQAVPLKETDAYKQMLQSAQSAKSSKESQETGKVAQMKDEESLMAELEESSSQEDGDEIEEAARISTPPTSGRSSGGRQKRNVLSSLGGTDMFGLGSPDDEKDEKKSPQAGIELNRSGEMSSPDKSDIISSASETPRESGGYVPSAIDNSLKSSGRKSDAIQRSSAFWGEESDLDEFESEMSVPMGTGNLEDEKDDFDFYD